MKIFGFGKDSNNSKVNVVNRKSDYSYPFGIGRAVSPSLNNDTALLNATVYSAVKLISSGIAQTPLRVIEEKNGSRKVVKDHWASRLLSKRPNQWQTPFEFIEGMAVNYLFGRGALALKVMVGGEVRELLPVPSGAFTVETLSDYSVQYRVQFSNGSQGIYSADEVLFIRGMSTDGYTANPLLDAARNAAGLSNSLEEAQLQTAASGGMPSGILALDGSLGEDRKRAMAEQWAATFAEGGRGIPVLDAGSSFIQLSESAADTQILESRKFQIEEICRLFNIQPILLGHSSGINPDGVSAALRLHIKICLMPHFKRFEQALNRDILGNSDSHSFDFDDGDLLRGDFTSQGAYFVQALGNGVSPGFLSLNEIRRELGEELINEDWANVPSRGGYGVSNSLDNPTPQASDKDK